jgi:outer membrane protein
MKKQYAAPLLAVIVFGLCLFSAACNRQPSAKEASPGVLPAGLKLGTVDMNRVFNEYYKTKDAQTKYAQAEAEADKELNNRVDALKKSIQEISQINAALEQSDLGKEERDAKTKDREAKVSAARSLDREIAEYRNAKQKSLQDQFLRMRKGIVEDIMKSLAGIVKSKGYDLVFDRSGLSAGAVPVVIYAREDLDFSQEVLVELNKNAPSGSGK